MQFVIADVGLQLTWIELEQCFNFWKSEAQKHLIGGLDRIYLEDFPDEYAYRPILWMTDNKQPIVVLEKLH